MNSQSERSENFFLALFFDPRSRGGGFFLDRQHLFDGQTNCTEKIIEARGLLNIARCSQHTGTSLINRRLGRGENRYVIPIQIDRSSFAVASFSQFSSELGDFQLCKLRCSSRRKRSAGVLVITAAFEDFVSLHEIVLRKLSDECRKTFSF